MTVSFGLVMNLNDACNLHELYHSPPFSSHAAYYGKLFPQGAKKHCLTLRMSQSELGILIRFPN